MTLKAFNALLESTGVNVAHYDSVSEALPLIVFFETGRKYYWSDNKPVRKSWAVDVHFYTHTEFDPIVEVLEDLFAANDIPFDMVSVQYGQYKDGRDGVIYYKFECEVCDG